MLHIPVIIWVMYKHKHYKVKRAFTLIFITLVIACLGVFVYRRTVANNKMNESGVYTVETSSSTAGTESQDETDEDTDIGEDSNSTVDPKSESGNITILEEPTGNFVSTHRVSSETKIESTCLTTPGAKCKIILTRSSVVKELNEMTTDRNGYTAWIWSPKELGITSGSWEVKAVATSGDNSKESVDATPLEVTK